MTTLVAAAIGYNAERGDAIAVQAIPFDTSVEDREKEAAEAAKFRHQLIYGVIAVFLVILIISALVILRRRRRGDIMEAEEGGRSSKGLISRSCWKGRAHGAGGRYSR